jgi:hypothetical protein
MEEIIMSFLSGGGHHREAVTGMKKIFVIFLFFIVLSVVLFTGAVSAVSETGNITHTKYGWDTFDKVTVSGTTGPRSMPYRLQIANIANFKEVRTIQMSINTGSYSTIPTRGVPLAFTMNTYPGGIYVASGEMWVFTTQSDILGNPVVDTVYFDFSHWDMGSLTGSQVFEFYGPAKQTLGWSATSDTHYTNSNQFYFEYGGRSNPRNWLTVYSETDYDNYYNFTDTSSETGSAEILINRLTPPSPSWVNVTSGGTLAISEYRTSGMTLGVVYANPVELEIVFADGSSHTKTFTLDNPSVITTGTPTLTPTPTPVPELCGYWSLAVNTSNILMNEYVNGTLTETDPSDRYDMIDWYRVLPSGQEYLAIHYVYDPGLFGLGAGWFEVTSSGAVYASSLAQAMGNDIQFTTAGANHLRVKIYDDKSILPMVYHDYDLGCTLNQVVYVGETTQASNTLGINVKECDTSAMLPYVNIGVYDYQTGQWQNKTSEMISTTYFNVVPGHNVRVVANKTGWLNSDTDYTIPATPYLYEVCLKRPLVDIEDKSYVFFNVRDSVTLTGLFQANIQLSDGQIQNTLPSGYAGFSVNDSETYIYTVTKPGYQSFSDSFSISEDTTIPVKLVQISPTPTLTYPVTTLPTFTITGTGTVTPTGTGTGVWSNTTATLSPADKTYKTTKGLDVWYNNIETLSGLLFVAAVFGAIGLISDSMSRRRRR